MCPSVLTPSASIIRRIGAATGAFQKLDKFFRNTSIALTIKATIYQHSVLETLLGHLARLPAARLHKQVLFAQMDGFGNRDRHLSTLKEQCHADVQRLIGTYDGQSHSTLLGTAWLRLACDADFWNLKVRSLAAVYGD